MYNRFKIMEMIDVIDDENNVINTVSRDEIIEKNLLHRGSTIFVFNKEGKILVTRRSKDKKVFPNKLEIGQGGKVCVDETYDETAYREIEEEVGIKDVNLEFMFIMKYSNNYNSSIEKVYRCTYDGPISFNDGEVSEYFWKSIDEIKDMIEDNPKQFSDFTIVFFKKYLELINGFKVKGCPAEGCKYCVKGEKLVLFITGLCGQRCHYCPVSEKKFGKDDIYANEWKIESKKDLLEEIRFTDAKGAGITGGDPLCRLSRTCKYISFLKEKMGKKFHIHLYTPFQLVTSEAMKKLYNSGLDEIRFHPKIGDNKEWNKIKFALKYNWDIGLEIPCLPNEIDEIKNLLDYFHDKIKFINLNELEFSDTEVSHYNMSDYQTNNNYNYGAKGSEEVANLIIKYTKEKKYNTTIYFCSSYLKDRVQMGNRIKRRAKKVAKEYDEITEEGMLIRGCIYLEKPMKKDDLVLIDKKEYLPKLFEAKKLILEKCEEVEIDIDLKKLRLITYPAYVEHFSNKIRELNFIPTIVEEYPTADAVEIEIDFL